MVLYLLPGLPAVSVTGRGFEGIISFIQWPWEAKTNALNTDNCFQDRVDVSLSVGCNWRRENYG